MRNISKVAILALLVVLAFSGMRVVDQEPLKKHHQEKYAGNAPNLTVHLIPHSHDDVGWLKTVDDYFYGANMSIAFAAVQFTYDTIVTELVAHPQYKFSVVEMAFLYRWWNQATEEQKSNFKKLISNGQIQFINAGWCMSDEANMYYEDFIDQMTVGLRWLKDTFGVIPDAAWHIDPFGHHSASASLFSQMGFNSFFFARIDYQDKLNRLKENTLQMVWRPYQYDGEKNNYIFTHVNYNFYSPPPGFCYDARCRDEPIRDDPDMQEYNLDRKGNEYAAYFQAQGNHFRTKNLMHTIGGDFQYSNSRMWFKNVDKLIKYVNQRPQFGLNIIYSTPNDYMKEIRKEQATYPTKTDDFFPYADNDHSMWTGYFTSRTALKGFVKDLSRFTQTVRKHVSELKISGTSETVQANSKQLEKTFFGLQQSLGILQHHDAVAGTAKQYVTDDYVATGIRSATAFNKIYKQIKKEQIFKESGENINSDDLYINLFWNESGITTGLSDRINKGETILVNFYNPGAKGTYPISLRVPNKDINVVYQSNRQISGDVICANLKNASDCQLLFNLEIEESSNAYVKLVALSGGSAKLVPVKELTVVEQIKEFSLGSDKLRFTRGNQSFDLTINGNTESFKIFYNYYEGWDSDGQTSGAYIFRPKSNTPKSFSNISRMYYADGQTLGMIVLEGDKTITRCYFQKEKDFVRNYGFSVQTQLDSIPVQDKIGKEVTLNIKTNKNNNKQFYTDSMGLQQQKRVLDYRPSWNYTAYQPVAGNYYPINSFIRLSDANNKSVTVLTDRSQGGSVIRDGEFQIMIHRRLLVDDNRGVNQSLNQLDYDKKGLRQTLRHYVVFGNNYRTVQKALDQRILPSWAPSKSNSFSSVTLREPPISVPSSVKLYLRPFEDDSYMLRLHNMNPNAKVSVTIGDGWTVTEHTLAVNQLLSEWKSKQMTWKEESSEPETTTLFGKVKYLFTDISQTIVKKVNGFNLLQDKATTIELREFEMKAFKLTKA